MLRATRPYGPVFDIDVEFVKRKMALEALKAKRSPLPKSQVGRSEFARKIIPSWDTAPQEARTTYEEFLGVIGEVTGGEMQSEEIHQAADVIYEHLCDANAGRSGGISGTYLQEKKKELVSLLGHVSSDAALRKAADVAVKLRGWQAKLKELSATERTEARPASEGRSTAVMSSMKEGKEFGSWMEFQLRPFWEAEDEDIDEDDEEDVDAEVLEASGLLESSEARRAGSESWASVSGAGWDERSSTPADIGGHAEEAGSLRWLKRVCDHFASLGGGAQFTGDELALNICRALDSDDSIEKIANEIVELVGYDSLDTIQVIISHRKGIVAAARAAMSAVADDSGGGKQQGRMPTYGTQVSVQSETDRQLDKIRRKEGRRQAKKGGITVDPELGWLFRAGGFQALVSAEERKEDIIDRAIGTGDGAAGSTGGTGLPSGSSRKVFKGYEEVHVPPAPVVPMKAEEKLVKISELDEFAQLAFEGYKTLNRIQSRIFDTAYNTNENILVCAPTGAGKTNIAMICVLHEVKQHFKYDILQKDEFKIVYVAPMKALAAEVTAAFSRRLAPLGLAVRELTGDMQLTKKELEETQMIVTTPEKWDVITRKSSDVALASLVKLLIVDEVHLLNDDRGPVIEVLIARTLRQVEATQSMIRIVGLSATLPNYLEVSKFLRVGSRGLFFFDASYRPVPLSQQYIGITEQNYMARNNLMHEICYRKVVDSVKRGEQAMVFVNSRKDTVKTARILIEFAQRSSQLGFFSSEKHPSYGLFKKEAGKSRNRDLAPFFQAGFGTHHAGMLRQDRSLTERMFSEGLLKVLVCTATLAWGVNLPAHTVIIKGTQLYDAKAGGFRELSMLDVMQIFGRAGRPQFDTSGEGIIITTHNKLAHYLRLLTHQLPIESQFISSLKDNLNAEVVLGTVTNVREASIWLGYTYLYVRMLKNPLAYGITWEQITMDPGLVSKRKELITDAARSLDRAKMLRFDERSGNLYVTDLGRVASHYYIQYTSVETYNELFKPHMSDSELINLVAHSSEFENIVVREEELPELSALLGMCPLEVRGGAEDKYGKANILIQVYLSRIQVEAFSLIADSAYINASLGRIMRALFEITLRRGWCSMAGLLLEYSKAVDKRIWPHQHPLRQFESLLSAEVLMKLEERGADMNRLYDMDEKEIGALIRHPHAGKVVAACVSYLPYIHLSAVVSPLTRSVLQVSLTITPEFVWKDKIHGKSVGWWIWVEDSANEHIYHNEYFRLTKKMFMEGSYTLGFTIPIFEPLPPQYYIRAIADSWLGAETLHTVSFQHLILPERHPPHTELLDLRPLPISALKNPVYESLYKFTHFNPIQTQAFHVLYHTDHNLLLGAPTGSGKTISAELAMLRVFNTQPDSKVIYIAPLKALVRERIQDWKKNLVPKLGKRMVELTGDFTPDLKALLSADIIISTPEKWDGISRNWQNRGYVKMVGLVVLDEIHLLGGDRGPILEVIVSRMRYISAQTERPVRFIGLSTALANASARCTARHLDVQCASAPGRARSVRMGYPGKFYCPRMMAMNKPTYMAITTHSPVKPVLVFVSSRRQTRLTALDLIQFAVADERPRQFINMEEREIEDTVAQISDTNLKHTIQFGIGLHHAGLSEHDRSLVEDLFARNKIQGTEFYDAKGKRYVDFPITDVLQMMGRAGRPQFDEHGKAVILVHEPKKSFWKKVMNPTYYKLEGTTQDTINLYLSSLVNDAFQALEDAGCIAVNEEVNTVEPLTPGKVASLYYLNYTTMALFTANINDETSVEGLLHVLCAASEFNELPVRHNEDKLNEELAQDVRWAVDPRTFDDPHTKTNLLLQAHFSRLTLPVSDYITDTKSVLDQCMRILQAMVDVAANGGWMQTVFNTLHLLQMAVQALWWDTDSSLQMLPHVTEDAMTALVARGISTLAELMTAGSDRVREAFLAVMSSDEAKAALQAVGNFPRVDLRWAWREKNPKPVAEEKTVEAEAGPSLALEVHLRRRKASGSRSLRAYAPRFPKLKEEGWWLVFGDPTTGELHAIKRVSLIDRLSTRVTVSKATYERSEGLVLYLVSDSYIGLDQEHQVKAPPPPVQSISEPVANPIKEMIRRKNAAVESRSSKQSSTEEDGDRKASDEEEEEEEEEEGLLRRAAGQRTEGDEVFYDTADA
ncbi:hypothetical protein CBR_g38192 [Chara braunii]|uniref:Activating signal cointegrator 1 complex subunit 3 n=1 Tax=Chara braunii TaxID=69332 RepID=A0A388LPF4_CHABU|nr:hypothetical protein CBR_g38192 [Chara braunii]|eukprot:GBG84220.1 hypothetical protein CBR_g38192 [Chara braunii]